MKIYIDGKIIFGCDVSQKTINDYYNCMPICFNYILFHSSSKKDCLRLDISMSCNSIKSISKNKITFSTKLEERFPKNTYLLNSVEIDETTFQKTIDKMSLSEIGLTVGSPTMPVNDVDFAVEIDAIDVGGRVFRPRKVTIS